MKKKKIDFYCATFLTGGIETTLLQILNHIDKERFSVRLIILFHTVGQEKLLHKIPDEVEVKYIVKSKYLNFLRSKRLIKRLPLGLKLVEEILLVNLRKLIYFFNIRKTIKQCDVLVDYSMCLMKQTHLLKDTKSVIYCHFSIEHLDRNNKTKNRKRINELIKYDRIITICDEMRSQLLQYHPEAESKTECVYNYMDKSYIMRNSMDELTPSDALPNYILAIGRLDESQKDYTTLLKAYAIARNKYNREEKLLILGKGRDKAYLESLCEDLQILDDVIFMGFETNPYKWIKNCKLFVHSSKFEGLPTVIVEALLLKKIVVATQCQTGVLELLGNGKAGYLCEVGDFEQLANKINAALTSDQNEKVINEGEKILKNFTIENTLGKFEDVLSKL